MLSEKKHVIKGNYKETFAKASKWLKHYAVLLVATYVSFTVLVNILGNQRGAILVVTVAFFVIITGVLSYTIWLFKKSRKGFNNNKDKDYNE